MNTYVNAFLLGVNDGLEIPEDGDLSIGMTWGEEITDHDVLNELYDDGVNVGLILSACGMRVRQ